MAKHERRVLTGDRNQCAGCGEFFNSVYAFDMHRTGPYSARRCRSADEMQAQGMAKNKADYWITPRHGNPPWGSTPEGGNADSSHAKAP